MNTLSLPEQLQGRATGVLFFASFGALWLAVSLSVGHRLDVLAAALLVVGWLALILPSIWIMRRAGNAQPARAETASDQERQRTFKRVNMAQWMAIVVAIVVLPMLHLELYVATAIVAIVALHLFPLARLFRYRLHMVTGCALLGWAIVIPLRVNAIDVPYLTGLGAGVILWSSALFTLTLSLILITSRMPKHETPA